MSVTHTMIGGTVLATVLSLGMSAILPEPAPIVVHGLTYANGEITQDRTVNSEGEVFFMHWQAEIVSVSTGDPLPECIGDGVLQLQDRATRRDNEPGKMDRQHKLHG